MHPAPPDPPEPLLARASRLLQTVAIGGLAGTLVCLALLWYVAWERSAIPDTWGEYPGNHGPWRHRYELRQGLWFVFELPVFAGLPAGVALVLRPGVRPLGILCLCGATWFGLLATHFWLVD